MEQREKKGESRVTSPLGAGFKSTPVIMKFIGLRYRDKKKEKGKKLRDTLEKYLF
jgi:hypothetical protein